MDPGWKRLRGPVAAVAALPGLLSLIAVGIMLWLPPFRSSSWASVISTAYRWHWVPVLMAVALAAVRMRAYAEWLLAEHQQVTPRHAYHTLTCLCIQAARSLSRWTLVFLAAHAVIMLRLMTAIHESIREPIVYQYANQQFLVVVIWLLETLAVFAVLLAALMAAGNLFPRPALYGLLLLALACGIMTDPLAFILMMVSPILLVGLLLRALENTSLDVVYDEENPPHLVQRPDQVDLFTLPPFCWWTAALRRRRETMGSVPRPWEKAGK